MALRNIGFSGRLLPANGTIDDIKS